MKGNPEVIKSLVSLLAAQASANMQYRLDWRVVNHFGAKGSAHSIHKLGTRAHKFQKILADRILDLGGDTSHDVAPVAEQSTLTDVFKNEAKMETNLIALGEAAIALAVTKNDEATAEKLRHIEERDEKNLIWVETQLDLIGGMGEGVYIASHLKK